MQRKPLVLPLFVSLGLSAIVQVIIATDLLNNALIDRYGKDIDTHWLYAIALTAGIVIACALGSLVVYTMDLYKKHLLAGDSTFGLRVVMLTYPASSVLLIYSWINKHDLSWELAAILSIPVGLFLLLWIVRSQWESREIMRVNGQLDHVTFPRMSTAFKVWHPIKWFQIMRLAAWDPIQTPDEARERHAAWVAQRQARKAERADRKRLTKS